MRARQDVPESLLRLAREQAGVISRFQASGQGLTPAVLSRLISDGWWGRLERGVYLVPDSEPTWLAHVWAAVLLGGPAARVCGPAAARLQGLLEDDPWPIDVLIPFDRRVMDRSWVVFRRERDRVRAVSTGTDPPRTRIEDTVFDLCSTASHAGCIDWLTMAVQRRLTTPEALQRSLQSRPRQPRRRELEALLVDVSAGVHSSLEHSYLHDVEEAHSLVRGTRQHTRPGGGGYVDVLYEQFAVVVELDGRTGHTGEGKLRDRRRDNHHTRAGLRSLRFGWHEVTQEPCAVALEVAEVLVGLGWTGYPSRCPRCLG